MRLGGPVHIDPFDPDAWAAEVRRLGYRAAYCPVDYRADDALVQAVARAAEAADIVIAEAGAWNNPLSKNADEARAAIEHCRRQLDLADRIGARCCVNISGACGDKWDGPHPDNLTPATFDRIVESVRAIVDDVKPTRTFYTLEPMPWAYPNSPETYLDLVRAVDRPSFAVHLDPINMIAGVERYYANGDFIRHCFALLGPYIKSCHAKDIVLREHLTLHLDEMRPGTGALDWPAYLTSIEQLSPDMPLLVEHLPNQEEYRLAADHIRGVAAELGVTC